MNNPDAVRKENKKLELLRVFLAGIERYSGSAFYRNHFAQGGFKSDMLRHGKSLAGIPELSWEDLASVALKNRLYKNDPRFVKVVYRDEVPFLIAKTLKDIGDERYGLFCERPLIALENVHESIEVCLWFYKHNVLPLIRQRSLKLSAHLAKRYAIDALATDTKTALALIPYLKNYGLEENISRLIIIDTMFDTSLLKNAFGHVREIKLVFSIPEAGGLAEWSGGGIENPVFTPYNDAMVEPGEQTIVTKIKNMPTPIIRYVLRDVRTAPHGNSSDFVIL